MNCSPSYVMSACWRDKSKGMPVLVSTTSLLGWRPTRSDGSPAPVRGLSSSRGCSGRIRSSSGSSCSVTRRSMMEKMESGGCKAPGGKRELLLRSTLKKSFLPSSPSIWFYWSTSYWILFERSAGLVASNSGPIACPTAAIINAIINAIKRLSDVDFTMRPCPASPWLAQRLCALSSNAAALLIRNSVPWQLYCSSSVHSAPHSPRSRAAAALHALARAGPRARSPSCAACKTPARC